MERGWLWTCRTLPRRGVPWGHDASPTPPGLAVRTQEGHLPFYPPEAVLPTQAVAPTSPEPGYAAVRNTPRVWLKERENVAEETSTAEKWSQPRG